MAGYRRLVWEYRDFGGEERPVQLKVFVDSDWAGRTDRKSTSGGIVSVDGAAIKHWSRTQKARALSFGEAEYYAVVTGNAEGLGAQSLATDLGWDFRCRVVVKTDSSVAKSVAGRRGLGKLRHVELKYLWVQEAVAKGRIAMKKIIGHYNPADIITKPKERTELGRLLGYVGAKYVIA